MEKIIIKKESLIDWSVKIDGKHVAWITKAVIGYNVQFADLAYKYFHRNFREAKAFAISQA